ncbi:MAG: thiamine pyrophosphate-binding protein [Actinomycetota bacterium]|nr:thiamine pyrophosphate-binding protein [Actinomycetota bacterium]
MSPIRRTAGAVLIDELVTLGVTRYYSVPGESFLAVLEALRAEDRARLISTRHESGASFMAEADAKLTGVPAVAMATRAPGAANLAIGVHTAWHDSTPLVALIGQVEARWYGSGLCFQEIDLEAFYRPFTKWQATLEHPDDAARLARQAMAVATGGRPGPVVIALPNDVLSQQSDVPREVPAPPSGTRRASAAELAALSERLGSASAPVLIVGGRCRGSWDELVRLAEGYGAGVYAAFRRQDQFPNDHPAYLGHLTLRPAPAVLDALEHADVVVALGCRMSEVTTQSFRLPAAGAFFVHVDPDAGGDYGPGRVPDVALDVDVAELIAALADQAPGASPLERIGRAHGAYLRDRAPLAPSGARAALQPDEVVAAMARRLPSDCVVTNDAGNFSIPLHRQWRFVRPNSQLAPTSGAMGYAVPAAVAAGIVDPSHLAVATVGDGGYLMTGQEIETAVREHAKVVVVVFRNGLYGTIAMHQARSYGELSGVEIGAVDIARHAESLGALGLSVTDRSELDDALDMAVRSDRPAVLDVVVDPEAITPSARLGDLLASARSNPPT